MFWPYLRDPDTLARPWAVPGTPGLMHRIGGLEKEDGSGNISYDPANHERMVQLRAGQDRRDRRRHPAGARSTGDVDDAELLVLGWGSTWGAIDGAVRPAASRGPHRSPHAHLTHLNPFPADLGDVLRRYPKVLVPEMNLGPAVAAGAGRVPRRRRLDHEGARARRSPPASSNRPSWTTSEVSARDGRSTRRSAADHDAQGLDQRPGGPLVPGCGDYSILAAVQLLMPELGVRRENTVFVSGIGCAARFPYYMNTYGMHSHPRPGAGDRHRAGHGPPRPGRVGGQRRRRRACRSAATT